MVSLLNQILTTLAASIKLIELPDLPPGGDASDFLDGFDDAEAAAERLSILIEQAEPYQPKEPPATDFERGILTFDEFTKIEMPPRMVFLDPWIQEQSITLMSG